jgi:enoyl-CoA hydratase/carnithine racemase
MSEAVLMEKDGAVGRLVINRPEARNSLNADVMAGLYEGLDRFEADPEVRVIVLTGAGDKAFCAGADLRLDPSAGFIAMHEGRGRFADLVVRFQRCGKPIVARVNGHALGGGLGLACASDIVVAVDAATFGTPEIKLGLFPMMIMALLVRHVGRKKLLELMLTGGKFTAAEAVANGIANYAVPADQLDAKVAEIVAALASKSAAVLRLGKKAFYDMDDMSTEDALKYLHTMLTVNAMAEDAMEGVIAFMEKREPNWKDR